MVDVDAELLEQARLRGESDGLSAEEQVQRWARRGRLFAAWAMADLGRVRLALTGEGLTDGERDVVEVLRGAGATTVDLPSLIEAATQASTSQGDDEQGPSA